MALGTHERIRYYLLQRDPECRELDFIAMGLYAQHVAQSAGVPGVPSPLTPAQRRRIRHKAGHHLAAGKRRELNRAAAAERRQRRADRRMLAVLGRKA